MMNTRELDALTKWILQEKSNACQLGLQVREEPHTRVKMMCYVIDLLVEVGGETRIIRNIAEMTDTNIWDFDRPWRRKQRALGMGVAFVLPVAKHLQSQGINVAVDAPVEGVMFIRDFLMLPYGQMIT